MMVQEDRDKWMESLKPATTTYIISLRLVWTTWQEPVLKVKTNK